MYLKILKPRCKLTNKRILHPARTVLWKWRKNEISPKQWKQGDFGTLGSALQETLWGAWGGNKTAFDCIRNLQGERTLTGAGSHINDSRKTVLVCLDLQNPIPWCSDSNTARCNTLGKLCAGLHPTQLVHICFMRQLHRGAITVCTDRHILCKCGVSTALREGRNSCRGTKGSHAAVVHYSQPDIFAGISLCSSWRPKGLTLFLPKSQPDYVFIN